MQSVVVCPSSPSECEAPSLTPRPGLKLRCDRVFPCSSCQKRGYASRSLQCYNLSYISFHVRCAAICPDGIIMHPSFKHSAHICFQDSFPRARPFGNSLPTSSPSAYLTCSPQGMRSPSRPPPPHRPPNRSSGASAISSTPSPRCRPPTILPHIRSCERSYEISQSRLLDRDRRLRLHRRFQLLIPPQTRWTSCQRTLARWK